MLALRGVTFASGNTKTNVRRPGVPTDNAAVAFGPSLHEWHGRRRHTPVPKCRCISVRGAAVRSIGGSNRNGSNNSSGGNGDTCCSNGGRRDDRPERERRRRRRPLWGRRRKRRFGFRVPKAQVFENDGQGD